MKQRDGNGGARRYITAEDLRRDDEIDALQQAVTEIRKDVQSLASSNQRELLTLSKTVENLSTQVSTVVSATSSRGMISFREMWGGIGGLGLILAGFAWFVTNQAGQTIAPIANRVTAVEEKINGITPELRTVQQKADASTQRDAESATNRRETGDRVSRLEASVAANSAALRALEAKVDATSVEVETQFKGTSNAENLRWIDEHRRYGVIFEKVFGQPWPGGSFFPPSNFREVK